MKTEVIMFRDLHGLKVRQNIISQLFNANDLLEIYNKINNKNPKRLDHYLQNSSSKEMIEAILKDNLNNSKESELEITDNSNTQKVGYYDLEVIQTKRGKNGGTWVHPYLLVDLAMWLSAEFRLTAIKWVYDGLIKVRENTGDDYKEINNLLLEKFPEKSVFQFPTEANLINALVFGFAGKNQKDTATEQELKLLSALQNADMDLIKSGITYYERKERLLEYKRMYLIMNKLTI